MYNINNNCQMITFSPIETMPEKEEELLEENFEAISVNYTDDGLEQYVCYARNNFSVSDFFTKAQQQDYHFPSYEVELLADKNWLKETIIKFSPYEVGDFLIYGFHEEKCPETKKIPIQVYAATAFGSSHQTTKMCLEGICELKNIISTPKKILDMGTGSGILAIASAKLWNNTPKIIAADLDKEATLVTENNTITNNVEKNIKVILSNGYQNKIIDQNAPYDLILANILANPLKEMSHNAYKNLSPKGCYLISGFIDNQENDIIQHHIENGFKVLKIYKIDNWRAALLQKS